MPEPTPNDPTGKLRDIATKSAHFIVDELGDALAHVRMKLRAEHEAGMRARGVVKEITDLLTAPAVDDPLTVINEIEDRLGVDHYDWSKYGQWIRRPTNDD